MADETARGEVIIDDDFVFDNITRWTETTVSGASQDIVNKHGGWWRHTLAGDDTGALLTASERVIEIDEGFPVVYEVRVQPSDVSVACVFVGLTDDAAESTAIPYQNEGGAVVSAATDCVGFLLEGEQDETWNAVGVQNGTGNTAVALTKGADAADATTQTLRMVLYPDTSGRVEFYIDGKLVSTQTAFFRSGIVFCACVATDDRNSAYTVDYDYITATAPRSGT